ncbi:MAG: hypothetical protein E5X89_25185 [Mesorhizobium sp.]|nr:MAG: hypothetical protein E5X88_14665 [Mesorhizobium sp.]TIO31059.1 MAG: hypothetical protein E5X89_25185 [Mesorhizobium sp.]TIP12774.1 MAG: hypothetical protein E5X73_10905 [Mesorhizobium sp.]
MAERFLLPFSPFTGRKCPEGADEGRHKRLQCRALPLICLPASSPRERGEGRCSLAWLQAIGGQR